MDRKNPTIVAFLDLAKAFDTVSHKILLDKLYKYGTSGIAFDLMKSYLAERSQFVRVKNVKSDTHNVSTGVPTSRNHTWTSPIFTLHK